jgi:hypothetical protein
MAEERRAETGAATGDRSRWSRPARWLGENVGKAALTALVGLGVAGAVTFLGKDPSIPEQLDEIRAEVSSQGYTVRTQKKLRFRTASPAYLFVLQPPRGRTDELRVYNEEEGELELAYRFAPRGRVGSQTPFGGLRFSLIDSFDFGDDGRLEVIGSYDYAFLGGPLRVPVSLAWDEVARRYQLAPLIRRPPQIDPTTIPGPLAKRAYSNGVDLRTAGGGFRAWGVRSIAIVRSHRFEQAPESSVLLSGLPASNTRLRFVQVNPWMFRFKGARPEVFRWCFQGPTARNHGVITTAVGDEETALRRTWERVRREDQRARSGLAFGRPTMIGAVVGGSCLLGE